VCDTTELGDLQCLVGTFQMLFLFAPTFVWFHSIKAQAQNNWIISNLTCPPLVTSSKAFTCDSKVFVIFTNDRNGTCGSLTSSLLCFMLYNILEDAPSIAGLYI